MTTLCEGTNSSCSHFLCSGHGEPNHNTRAFERHIRSTATPGSAMGALVAVVAIGLISGCSVAAPNRPNKEVWVTHQTADSQITVLAFPKGEVLDTVALPDGTMPHYVTFGTGAYAYASGMGDGSLHVIDADRREIVASFKFADSLTHHAQVAPDRTNALVSVLATSSVHKILVDEVNGAFSDSGESVALPGKPICSIYRPDSQRAYVSLLPSGLAVIDVASMSYLETLPTDGFVACAMVKASNEANTATIASGGANCNNTETASGCGHIYTLDMTSDTLIDRGVLGASNSWHSWINDDNIGVGTAPFDDKLVIADMTTDPVSVITTLDMNLSEGPDEPDAVGAGTAIRDGTIFVSLRASGKVAIIDLENRSIKTILQLAPAVTGHHPALCNGCAVHGISYRPDRAN